jgi:hypothetical protein
LHGAISQITTCLCGDYFGFLVTKGEQMESSYKENISMSSVSTPAGTWLLVCGMGRMPHGF